MKHRIFTDIYSYFLYYILERLGIFFVWKNIEKHEIGKKRSISDINLGKKTSL